MAQWFALHIRNKEGVMSEKCDSLRDEFIVLRKVADCSTSKALERVGGDLGRAQQIPWVEEMELRKPRWVELTKLSIQQEKTADGDNSRDLEVSL